MTSPSENREVECYVCRYHYRAKKMLATERGYRCDNAIRCNQNLFTRRRMSRR